MAHEGFEDMILSAEQERQKELFPKLFTIAQKFYSSSENVDASIYLDMDELKNTVENPSQYYFWSLLDHTISSNESDYDAVYDTQNNDIEKFFLKLEKKMDIWEKVTA